MTERLGKFKLLADEPGAVWSPWHWRTNRYPNKVYKIESYELELPDLPQEVTEYRECGMKTSRILEIMARMGFGNDCHDPILLVTAGKRIRWATSVAKLSVRRPWDNMVIQKWQISNEVDPDHRLTCSELRRVIETDPLIKVSMSGVTPKPYLSWIGKFGALQAPCLIFGEYCRDGMKTKMKDMEEK